MRECERATGEALTSLPEGINHSFCSNTLPELIYSIFESNRTHVAVEIMAVDVLLLKNRHDSLAEVLLRCYFHPIGKTAAGGQPSCYRDVKMRGFLLDFDRNLRT